MKTIIDGILNDLIFWMAWIIIPLLMEIIPSIIGSIILVKKKLLYKEKEFRGRLPEVTIIVPVYNSASTLYECIKSINDCTYPNELLNIIVVNNGSSDESFNIFCICQEKFKDLPMRWLSSKKGKSKALNMAIFNSEGKYIINIDSDGVLHKDAVKNMILRFERDNSINCATGVVLVESSKIKNTKELFLRFIRECEMMEYYQAFLAGRNYEAEYNSIYTISGAFSCFKKSLLLKTKLYNTDTISEDTHVTFQIKHLLKKKVHICENAFFFVEPIDNFDKLYTQRQRWQRGQVEISNMFFKDKLKSFSLSKFDRTVYLLLFDHTFAFPRMIWYFALICLTFLNYSLKTILSSLIVLNSLYIIISFIYSINIISFLTPYKEMRKEYISRLYILFIMPLYNFIVFWIRIAGIINSINRDSSWRTVTFSQERTKIKEIIKSDFNYLIGLRDKLKRIVNK